MFTPVTDPALVAHWPLAVAAVDVQRRGRLVQAGDGAACAQLDDLVWHVPQLEPLQQIYIGHVPVLLKWKQYLVKIFSRLQYSFKDLGVLAMDRWTIHNSRIPSLVCTDKFIILLYLPDHFEKNIV